MTTMTKPDYDFTLCGDMRLSDKHLPMLVVYDNPTDFAGKTVVRRADIHMGPGKGEVVPWPTQAVFDTLLEARHWIRRTYPHLTCLHRMPDDAPQILETWL